MATIQLDDLLGKKKDTPQVLDLSRSIVQTQDEYRKLLERVPEYKIRPEKVREEDVKVKDRDTSFQSVRKEFKHIEYAYSNPIPPDMRSVPLEDLIGVAIDWKMLTSIRPKLKQEEEMFSRLVMMGKLHLRTAAREKREDQSNLIIRHKNRAGILETKVKVCGECGEEFCNGNNCGESLYDCFLRVDVGTIHVDPSGKSASSIRGGPKSVKKKKKPQKRSRSARRKKKTKVKSGKRKKKDKNKD